VNENALVRKWSPLATTISREFFHPTLDYDDLRQEALIAVMIAGRTYDPAQGSFSGFAAMCIKRRLSSTLKTASRMKRDWRMELPRETVMEDGDVLRTVDLVPALHADSHELLAERDEVRRIVRGVTALTPLERRAVLAAVNDDHPHSGGIDKSIDNAVQRARRKLRVAA